MMHTLFRVFVWAHLVAGAVGLVLFWVAGVFSKKGGEPHKRWGLVFVYSMLFTGSVAVGMSALTLIDPMATHPHFVTHPQFHDATLVRGLFGWMMQYLAVLTVSLAWHGWGAVKHKRTHADNRRPLNVFLQIAVMVTAVNCFVHGLELKQPVMLGLPIVGVASGVTNLWFAFRPEPLRFGYLIEHVKALVGAAISAYTAFLAFGLVRLMPEQVFNPFLWAAPLTVGLSIIIWHFVRLIRLRRRGAPISAAVPGAMRGAAPGT
ncbi:MAG: hypothetical protein SFW08_13040 [Gemmatimonadaceae bacterium]|nr:hypothetical protein [Gemmatimonadaceae bacterium]